MKSQRRALVTSSGAHVRLNRAAEWLAARGTSERVLVIGASLDAASELLREVAARVPAAFGWERLTLGRLAALCAAPALRERELSPLSPLGVEAVCARIVHELGQRGRLGRYQPLSRQPGLARAFSQTLQELRLAGARPKGDLGSLLDAYEAELSRARLADRAEVFRLAIQGEPSPLLALPALLVDVPLHSELESRLVARFSGDVLATAPEGDQPSLERLSRALGRGAGGDPASRELLPRAHDISPECLESVPRSSLTRVQKHLFAEEILPPAATDDSVSILSAPGESRECVEIARLVQREARNGVRFDKIAVLLRAPGPYRALLEEALTRAGIPAHFAQGTVRPDPAGRAFLALLACATDGLSVRRFTEYLSLGELPEAIGGAPPKPLPRGDRWVPPDIELSPAPETPDEEPPEPRAPSDLNAPVVAGSLRAPWRWEKLLLEAAVIGERSRWERRLSGLERELRLQIEALAEDDARLERTRRDLADLETLREFATPMLDVLSALPREASWGEWLDALSALATRALRDPERVLSVLAELAPMAPVGPVALDEIRHVLRRRLTNLSYPPAGKRYGKVFVAPVQAALGLSFDVVFVPALAEKLFPQKVVQDPLLPDLERRELQGLETTDDRVLAERLALRLAAGAARYKLVLSWPRVDAQLARARVPSFYGLEVFRAAEGTLPDFSELMRSAEGVGAARVGWPAPADPKEAIDEAEHDLSMLQKAFGEAELVKRGTLHYLLDANPHLTRALRARARRWLKRWTPADGLVDPSPEALAALARHLPSARPFSPTALQEYSACPYRFLLQVVHRLAPRKVPEAIDEIDPLSRGSLLHEVQFELLRELQEAGALPLPRDRLNEARARLDTTLQRIAAKWRDELCPAIPRVWDDCIAGLGADLREWLYRLAEEREWVPWRFELSFGLPDLREHDPHSTKDPIGLEEQLSLRGSIDLVERKSDGMLRATDHKSGKQRADPGMVIKGGAVLQPALYALVLQQLFPEARVQGGRLYYCTFAGNFASVEVPLDSMAHESVRKVNETLTGAIAAGFLPAAPDEGKCEYCDFQQVCGSGEEERVKKRKPKDRLQPLLKLRGMP